MASIFRDVLEFMDRLGVYDVLLPFILTFAIIYAIMEKTQVLGTEKVGDEQVTRRNLNSLVAFCIAFFVVASTQLVRTISVLLANVALLLILSVSFLLLIGSFHEDGKAIQLTGGWKIGGMVVMLLGLILIFLHSMRTSTGVTWLDYAWTYLIQNWNSTVVGTFAFLVIIIGGIFWITKGEGGSKSKKKDDDDD